MDLPERRRNPDLSTLSEKIDTLVVAQERVNVALFAKDANNEFETPGVMTVMQKIDKHIDVFCSIAHGFRKFVKFGFWIITAVAGAVAALKAAGWW